METPCTSSEYPFQDEDPSMSEVKYSSSVDFTHVENSHSPIPDEQEVKEENISADYFDESDSAAAVPESGLGDSILEDDLKPVVIPSDYYHDEGEREGEGEEECLSSDVKYTLGDTDPFEEDPCQNYSSVIEEQDVEVEGESCTSADYYVDADADPEDLISEIVYSSTVTDSIEESSYSSPIPGQEDQSENISHDYFPNDQQEPNSSVPTCSTCQKNYSNVDSLRAHELTHLKRPRRNGGRNNSKSKKMKKNEKRACLSCGLILPTSELLPHIRDHVATDQRQCELCNQTYSSTDTLREHMHSHYGIEPHQCKLCSNTYSLKQSLYNHITRVHKVAHPVKYYDSLIPQPKHYVKSDVKTTYQPNSASTSSFGTQTPAKPKKRPELRHFECRFCPYTSRIKYSVQRHEEKIHHYVRKELRNRAGSVATSSNSSESVGMCNSSPEIIVVPGIMPEVVQIRSPSPEIIEIMDTSNSSGTEKSKDVQMVQKNLKKPKHFTCEFCSFTSASRFLVRKHEQEWHNFVRTVIQPDRKSRQEFGISRTKVSFPSESEEISIIGAKKDKTGKQKTKEVIFECQFCTFTSTIKYSVQRHELTMHKHSQMNPSNVVKILEEPEKPEKPMKFGCKFCGFTSKTKYSAQRHEKKIHKYLETDPERQYSVNTPFILGI